MESRNITTPCSSTPDDMTTKETGTRRKIFSSRNYYNTRDDGVSSDKSELSNTASRLEGQLEAVRKHVGETVPNPTPARAFARLNSQTPDASQSHSREHMLLETIVNSHTKLVLAMERQAKEQLIMAQQIFKLQERVETLTNVQTSEIPNIKDSLEEITDTFHEVDEATNEIRGQLGDLSRSCVKREDIQANIEDTLEMKYPHLSEAARPHLQYAPSLQPTVTPAQGVQDNAQLDLAEILRFQTNCRREEDLYYLRTIEIRNFQSQIFERMREDVTRPLRHWEAKAMAQDQVGYLAHIACKVNFFWPDEGRAGSLRLIFDSMSGARRALTRLRGTRNSLREMGSGIRLEYYQMTSPRFHRERIQLYNLLKTAKAQGIVKNFSFAVVGDRLCIIIRARGQNNQQTCVTRLVALQNVSFDDFIIMQNHSSSSEPDNID